VDAARAERAAQEMEAVFNSLPHWMSSQQQERDLRQSLYKVLLGAGIDSQQLVSWANALLNLLRRAAE